jgi:molybdopterin biosynthesis enzyme
MIKNPLTFEEAKRAIEANFKAADLGVEEAVLLEAYNRVLAVDVAAGFNVPSFNSARVNGYAVKAASTAEATEEAPLMLKVGGCVVPGGSAVVYVEGEALEVMAGAVLPEGVDAVVALEDAPREDDTVEIYGPVNVGENVQPKGSDIKKGKVILEKGQVLGAAEIGVLAALGYTQVKVLRIPMVAVISVGGDVAELGTPLPTGKIFDVNGYCLSTAVLECGGKPVYFGVTSQTDAELRRILDAALLSADMVLVCGGSDAAETLDSLGKPGLIVNGITAKPGKTFAAAFINGKPVLLLPAEPSAALLTFHIFARSLVQRLAGRPIAGLRAVTAFAGARMFSAKGIRTYTLVRLLFDEKCRLIAQPLASAGAVSGLAEADGFVDVAPDEEFVDADGQVTVWLFRGYAGRT